MLSGAVVVAHNLTFDDRFLRCELRRIGVGVTLGVPGVCTMVASWSHIQAISYKQKVVFRTVVGTWPRDAHTALGDARNLSAIVAGFHRRLPDLRYVGPRPVKLAPVGRWGRMFARPVFEQALRWNSLPMTAIEYPLPAGVFREGVVQLFDARRPGEVLVTLMNAAGVGASQFGRELANTIVDLLADGQLPWNAATQRALESLMEIMVSREFAEILTDGVRDRVPPEGLLAPLLAGERWQVPASHPDRETLVAFLTDLGAHVLRSRRPALDARVHAGLVHRAVVCDLDPYLKDLRRRATEAGPAHLCAWARRHHQRNQESAGIPLGDQDGGEKWNQRMRFTLVNPERPPDWRWLVDPSYDERAERVEDRGRAEYETPDGAELSEKSTPATVGDRPGHVPAAKVSGGGSERASAGPNDVDSPADSASSPTRRNGRHPRDQRAGRPWATAGAVLAGLGVTTLVAAIVWLGADDRRRIAICDTGAAAAPATGWEPLGLAVLAPLALLVALGCVIVGYRRGVTCAPTWGSEHVCAGPRSPRRARRPLGRGEREAALGRSWTRR